MVDVIRTLAELQVLLADNNQLQISAQDERDFLVSVYSGFVSYDDQASKDTPVAGTAATPLKVEIDKLGPNTVESRAPFGLSLPAWNTTTHRFEFDGLEEFAIILGRFDFLFITASPNAAISIELEFFNSSSVSQGGASFKLPELKSAGSHTMFMVLPIFIDSNIINGELEFHILSSVNFTVSFGSMVAIIQR